MNEQTLLELQKAILSNEALTILIYKKNLGNISYVAKEVKNLSSLISGFEFPQSKDCGCKKEEISLSKYSNPYNVKDYSNPYDLNK